MLKEQIGEGIRICDGLRHTAESLEFMQDQRENSDPPGAGCYLAAIYSMYETLQRELDNLYDKLLEASRLVEKTAGVSVPG